MSPSELKDFLDEKVARYNSPDFIESDPIQIPYLFTDKKDIEVAGFLAATIAWGNRKMIINSAKKMMQIMGESPYDYLMHYHADKHDQLSGFVHRTFNAQDLSTFLLGLQNLYTQYDSLEDVFAKHDNLQQSIHHFKKEFFSGLEGSRSSKHISDPMKGSAAKRINMYLRWMVRQDQIVDFGIWKKIVPSQLSCPLDVHSGNVARKLGLLTRKQNNGKALAELDHALRAMDAEDPVKYDFALFGLGVFEKF